MQPSEYLEASERTERKFPDGLALTGDNQVVLRYLTEDLINIGKAMDHMKRHLVYGAECELSGPQSDFKPRDKQLDQRAAEFLHHALGKVTEAIEVYEAVIDHVLNGGELDEVNLFEELGDCYWYDAGFLRLLNRSIEQVWDTNIEKLRARSPEKFDALNFLRRDLDAERTTLEKGFAQ